MSLNMSHGCRLSGTEQRYADDIFIFLTVNVHHHLYTFSYFASLKPVALSHCYWTTVLDYSTGLQYSSEGCISEYLGAINSTDYVPCPGITKLWGCSSLVPSGPAQIFTGNYSSHVVCCITTTPLGSVVFPSIDGLLRFQLKRTSLVYSLAPGFCIAGSNFLPLSFGA